MVRAIAKYSLVVCWVFLLLGCSSSGFEPDHKTHITLWQGVNPPANREVLQKLIDRFNTSQPEIQVDSIYTGQPDQQIPKILAAVIGGSPPDLLWYAPTLTGRLVELDALRPLDDLLANSPVAKEIQPALLSTMQLNGKSWSIPFSTNNIGIFYRPSLFAAAGIKQLPTSWADLRQVARQLTQELNGDRYPDQHGIILPLGKGEFTVFIWSPFLWSTGGDLSDRVNTPAAQRALSFWQELVEDGTAILSQPERGYEEDNFIQGKVAMQISGSWALGFMQRQKIDFGVLPMPSDRRPATTVGGENLFLFKTNPRRAAAAWKFMEYVLSQDFQTEFSIATGYLPVNTQVQYSPAYQKYVEQHPEIRTFLDQMPMAQSRPINANYPRVSEAIGRAIEATLLQKSSPVQALEQAQVSLDLLAK
ncbi:MAG: ABC transporter substrate-binding protein [Pseudanabaenaceae cyanobacterium bins.68]|nr:ABC transporter substrate-binding protein [Pseudanabaenaceae cyanobacterium bins.68]